MRAGEYDGERIARDEREEQALADQARDRLDDYTPAGELGLPPTDALITIIRRRRRRPIREELDEEPRHG